MPLHLLAALIALAPAELLAAPAPELPAPEAAVLQPQAVLERARAARLAEDPAWLRLGHYRGRPGHHESQADGPAFFLAATGKTDPRAELEATIRAFYTPVTPAMQGARPARERHPLCRFPARFLWLSKRLALPASALPQPECPELFDFVRRIDARSAVLVFSSYYLNNPSSAFGHTFLRLRRADGGGSDLLDYGVDFSADVDTGNAVLYAFKGLTGLFPGTFKRMPYYYKVREYNDYESRDLWEYELDLSPEALTMLVTHVWELSFTYFDYYYVTENCSYHVLSLLEAANPALTLIDRLPALVIPADTVKVLFSNPDLVRRVDFRPSIRTQFRSRAGKLDDRQRDLVRALARQPSVALPPEWSRRDQSVVLDAALDYVDMTHAKAFVHNSDPAAAETRQSLLLRRSTLGVGDADVVTPPPGSQRPDRGHGSARAGAALGATSAGKLFQSLDLRLALHDLADPAVGFPRLAELEFLPTRLRWRTAERQLDLEDFAFFRVTSMTPMDAFDTHVSWKASFGAQTRTDDCARCLAGTVRLGAGGAVALGAPLALFFTTDFEGLYGPRSGWDLPVRGGVGPAGGLLLRAGPLSLLATADVFWYPWQQPVRLWHARTVLRAPLTRYLSLMAEGAAQRDERNARLGALVYF